MDVRSGRVGKECGSKSGEALIMKGSSFGIEGSS